MKAELISLNTSNRLWHKQRNYSCESISDTSLLLLLAVFAALSMHKFLLKTGKKKNIV